MFTSLFKSIGNVPGWVPSFSSLKPTFIEKKEDLDVVKGVEKAKKWPKISKRQFAMRFLASHIDNTSLEGSSSERSTAYWCHLVELWLSQEGVFLPFKIDRTILFKLKEILKDYGFTLDLHHSSQLGPSEVARKTLLGIEKQLTAQGYAYTCLGYRNGPLNAGHAIPLRIDYNKNFQTVTVHFLNLGAGVGLHPELEWDENYIRYHFRSFPITFSKEDFFGKKGLELFSRQIILMRKQPKGDVPGYSAHDVYGAFCLMGRVTGNFNSKLSLRSKKPQIGATCADKALELIIRDFLIEQKIPKEEIQRFFCNEKICSLLRFSHVLEGSKNRDEWLMLKKALQTFAIKVLKKMEKALGKKEVQFCKALIDHLMMEVKENKKEVECIPVTKPWEKGTKVSTSFKPMTHSTSTISNIRSPSLYLRVSIDLPLLIESCPPPAKFGKWLKNIAQSVRTLHGTDRGFYLLCRTVSQLPMPSANKTDYWNEIPTKEIPSLLDTMCKLIYHGFVFHCRNKNEFHYFHLKVIQIHTLYAIVDKLMRRIHPELKGFSPPFMLNLQPHYFYQFPQLPMGEENARWQMICRYFKKISAQHPTVLFGFHSFKEELDIADAVKEIKRNSHTKDPAASHLKFLAQFLENVEETSNLTTQYALLWENKNSQYLPKEYYHFQFLAQVSWALYTCYNCRTISLGQPLAEYTVNPEGVPFISYRHKNINEYQATRSIQKHVLNVTSFRALSVLDKVEPSSHTENEAMCLTLPKSSETEKRAVQSTKKYRDWMRISAHPSLQITSTIQWALDHLYLVRSDLIKDQIEKKLFAPNAQLIKRLKEAPHLISRLYQLVDDGLKFYGSHSKDLPHKLFFVRLGCALETHRQQAEYKIDLGRLKAYEKLLLSSIKQEERKTELFALYKHLRFLYSIALPRKNRSLIEMVKAGYWIRFNKDPSSWKKKKIFAPNWMKQEICYLEDKWDVSLRKLSHREIGTLCSEIFHLILPNISPLKGEWKGQYPHFKNGIYSFDLKQCIITRHRTERLWSFNLDAFRAAELYELPKEFHKPFEENNHLFWVGEKGCDTYNGKFHIAIEKGKNKRRSASICKKMTIDCKTHSYHTTQSSHSIITSLTQNKHVLWERVDRSGELVITDVKTGVPKYLLLQDTKELQVHKLGPKGKILPYQLVNIETINTSFFTRLGLNPTEICCWMDRSNRIAYIEMLPFNLTFHLKNQRLFCSNYPEYFISETQVLTELGNFNGALVLENARREKRILLATHVFKYNHEDFTTKVTMSEKSLYYTTVPYFMFTIDESSGMLQNEEPDAYFQLVMLFASMREYKTALLYLEQTHSYHFYPYNFDTFCHLKDRSPEALAFYLKVGLHFYKNDSQLIKDGYNSQTFRFKNLQHNKWLSRSFCDYLRFVSRKYAQIPAYIRLTPEEELSLLLQLETTLQAKLPHLLKTRKELLKAKKIQHEIHPSTYSLFEHSFRCIPQIDIEKAIHFGFKHGLNSDLEEELDPHFVRLTLKSVLVHFPKLYQRALKGDGVLDVFYLSRSVLADAQSKQPHIWTLATLLYLVCRYPSEFNPLKFSENPKTHYTTFKKILAKAIEIQKRSNLKKTSWAFKTRVSCKYSAKKILSLPSSYSVKPIQWKFKASVGNELTTFHRSLQADFLQEFVTIKTVPIITDTRSFIFKKLPKSLGSSPALLRLVESYRRGFKTSQSKKDGRDIFTLKEGVRFTTCLKEANSLLEKKKEALENVRKRTRKLANKTPEKFALIGLRKSGKDLQKITVDGILTEALDRENPSLISSANPSLSPKEIQQLLIFTMHYHVLSCHITQLSKGINALEKNGDVQAFGEALAVYGAFDPTVNPELLVFQSRTKMIARKDQGAFVSWLLEAPLDGTTHSKLLFEFEAGGGKGTFFTPIIKKQARKKGLFPISTSPASLYQIERKKQKIALKKAYKLNMEVLEIALDTKAIGKDFKWIYEKLIDYSKEDTLKIIPEVYYALDLKYQLALESEDETCVHYLSLTLNLFEEKSAGFIDEGRLNLSPFTQAKIGIGKNARLPTCDHKLFIHLYKALTNPKHQLKDGRRVCDVMKIRENKQAMTSTKDAEFVRRFLIKYMSNDPLLKIPQKYKIEIQNWWLSQKNPKPDWLKKQEKSKTVQARLIVEAGEYFHRFYMFTLRTVGQMRHSRSIIPKEEIDVPARQRKPTRAYFEEPYIALALTIQGTLQRGLSKDQCANLIDLLQETREVERTSTRQPPIDTIFASWIKTQVVWEPSLFKARKLEKQRWVPKILPKGKRPAQPGFKGEKIHLSDLRSKKDSDVELVHKTLSKNPEAIFWYLEKMVLHQVTYSTEHLTVTPQHFLNAFKMSTVYSAILGPTEAYGFYPSEEVKDQLLKQNVAFVAQVVHQLTSQENQQMLKLNSFSSPLEFFRNVWETHHKLFQDLRMLIDVGGMLRDFGTEEIASSFFDFMKELKTEAPDFDGIVLFQDSVEKADESDLMIWLKEWEKPVVLPKGDVVSGLESLGYEWKELKLLTLIDPNHATGSDVLQEEKALALLLLGENLPIGDLIQGVMRLRGFLKKQTIVWGILKSLAAQIEEELKLPCSAKTVLFWALNNEARLQEKEILLSAYQQIDYIVQKPARASLKKYLGQSKKQIQVWKWLRKGFVKKYQNDPLIRFGASSDLEKTFSVLVAYAKSEYERYGYLMSWEKAKEIHAELKIVLKATAAKIKEIPTKPLNNLGRETHIQCHQHQHLKTEQEKLTVVDLISEKLPPLEDKVHIYQPGFVTYLTDHSFASTASKIFNSKYFSKNLYYSKRLIHTAKSGSKSLGHTYLKPAQYMLVIYEQEELTVIAISDQEAAFFQKQLIGGEKWLKEYKQKKSNVNRQVALFTSDGFLAQNGPNKLGFSETQMEHLTTKHEWFREVISDIGLMTCQIRDISTFMSRAKKWKTLPRLWEKIKSWQPYPKALNTHAIDRIISKFA